MSLVDYPPLRPSNLRRTLEAQVPQKFLRDLRNRLVLGLSAPLSDELLFVDPATITQVYVPNPDQKAPRLRRHDSGRVLGGDWDLSVRPLVNGVKFRSCKAHFEDNVPWEHTEVFDKHLRVIADKGESDGCRTTDELLQRYERLDHLYADVKARGRLLPRHEVDEYFRREHGGIFVHIDRHGRPLRQGGGEHRFSIARLLNLPEIPVQPGVIHPDALRDGHLATLRRSIFDGLSKR